MIRTSVSLLATVSLAVTAGGCAVGGCAMSPPSWDDDDAAYDGDDGGVYSDDDDDNADDDDSNDDDDYTDDDTGDDDDNEGDDDDTEDGLEDPCDGLPEEPSTLFMSADDSNSQAAPALARQLIEEGDVIDLFEDPRSYEFLNYYNFYFPPAAPGHVDLVPQIRLDEDGEYSLMIGVVGQEWESIGRRPRVLTFSVDSSGSMSGQPMARVQEVLRAIAGNLEQGDTVNMVAWDSNAITTLAMEVVDGPDDPDLMGAIDDLVASGSTDLDNGLQEAYVLAQASYNEEALNRVILLSDGGANTGVVEETLIAEHADDGEAEGIYLVGVGMDDPAYQYDDTLMNVITDAGKGAYIYIDSNSEADDIFGDDERFLTVMEIGAREVQLSMEMPEGFMMTEFFGEEVSEDPEAVEPQHLAPNDAMVFFQRLVDCTPELHDGSEEFVFSVDWIDPLTREERTDSVTMTMDEMLAAAGTQLLKADVITGYSRALVDVLDQANADRWDYIDEYITLANDAYFITGDTDLAQIVTLLGTFQQNFDGNAVPEERLRPPRTLPVD